ncbi:MAG TPA: thioredoxin family protein [Rhizomicrobium sp.]|jgi:thiol-disulfide isomerase/thioredoxin|nr:thioredoxin family protein [Rhizomicrobium sp.]
MKTLALAALLIATPVLAAVPAPKPSIATLQQLPVVLMQPYDEHANADAAVAAAFDRAKKSHKRVLIDLGGNWCVDCIVLANFLKLPEMQRFMAAHYEIVAVDVGRFDRNLQIPARFGITGRLKGVPTLLIATQDGKLVNGDDVFATADASSMTPQALAAYLAKYAG